MDAAGRAEASLIDHARWSLETEGPYPVESDAAACDYADVFVEGTDPGWLEVLTLVCNHATATQPSLVPLRAGDVVRVSASHGPLAEPPDGPAEGFVAVRIGGEEIWSTTVPLPALASQSFDAEWTAPRDYPSGTPVLFHVHNHGTNSWRIFQILRLGD